MSHYIFNEAGSIPGIPGTFSNCRVDIDDAGNLTQTPLVALEEAPPVSEGTPTEPLAEPASIPAEAAPTIVQEQVPPGLALNIG